MIKLLVSVFICFSCLFPPLQLKAELPARVAADTLRQLSDTVIKVAANPALGFNFPYYLRIPKGAVKGARQFLIVETNNTGVNDTFTYHEVETLKQVNRNSLGSSICSNLKLPFLMPIFPRPAKEWKIYTHALDRESALLKSGDMNRLDLQLLAMIKDAKTQLLLHDIQLQKKILLNGFSASGTFANRFTLIHPTIVAAAAYGGINGLVILPVASISSTTLDYPLGINNFTKLFKKKLEDSLYKQVPQYIYMGEKDNNDAVLFDDAYSNTEQRKIYAVIGKVMLPDRFNSCRSVYEANNINSKFTVYPGIGHETNQKVFLDVCRFFRDVMKNNTE